jgi:hypothetical protein
LSKVGIGTVINSYGSATLLFMLCCTTFLSPLVNCYDLPRKHCKHVLWIRLMFGIPGSRLCLSLKVEFYIWVFSLFQCCGSGTFIPDPDFHSSWIPEPGSGSRIQKQQRKRGGEKFFYFTFLCSHKFHKIENCFSFEVLKKKIWANF